MRLSVESQHWVGVALAWEGRREWFGFVFWLWVMGCCCSQCSAIKRENQTKQTTHSKQRNQRKELLTFFEWSWRNWWEWSEVKLNFFSFIEWNVFELLLSKKDGCPQTIQLHFFFFSLPQWREEKRRESWWIWAALTRKCCGPQAKGGSKPINSSFHLINQQHKAKKFAFVGLIENEIEDCWLWSWW